MQAEDQLCRGRIGEIVGAETFFSKRSLDVNNPKQTQDSDQQYDNSNYYYKRNKFCYSHCEPEGRGNLVFYGIASSLRSSQ